MRIGVTSAIASATLVAVASPAHAQVVLPPGQVTLPDSGSYMYVNSELGDSVGGGTGEQVTTYNESTFTASAWQGGWSASGGTSINGGSWNVSFGAPIGQTLTATSYTGATGGFSGRYDTPQLTVSGNGIYCFQTSGQFDVNALTFASDGSLQVLDVTFEQYCNGSTSALFGRFRFEAGKTAPPPPPDTQAPTLYGYFDMTVEAPDDLGTTVPYYVFAWDDRDPAPTVSCNPASGSFFPVGTTSVTCTATDASGNTSTARFNVTVLKKLVVAADITSAGVNSAGAVILNGTFHCNRDTEIQLFATVTQLVANRSNISAYGTPYVRCTAPAVSWSTTTTGDSKFLPGKITADVRGVAQNLSAVGVQTTVTLTASRTR